MYRLHVPGSPPRALRWTTEHPLSSYGKGVLVYRNGKEVLDANTFRALRDNKGAWLETDRPDRARSALPLHPEESLGQPESATPELETIREGLGVATQTGFARLLGISSQQYHNLISGKQALTETQTRLIVAYQEGYRPADWAKNTVDARRKKVGDGQ